MTTYEQDIILLNDILDRNYYSYFERGDKNLCLTFYYNNKINNSVFIPKFPCPASNIDIIKSNLQAVLSWYQQKQFKTNIKIHDEFWLYETEFRSYVFELLLKTFSNDSDFKPKQIKIYTNVNTILDIANQEYFTQYIQKFLAINIQLIFSFETDLIDIASVDNLINVKNFIIDNNYILKVRINPNNFAYFDEKFEDLMLNFNNNIYLYEEANTGWTEYKINEYLEFLNKYITYFCQKYATKEEILNHLFNDKTCSLISLRDKGVIDNTCSKGQCSFYNSLCLLMEDLSINLCPKFQYDDQVIGKYLLDINGNIDKADPKTLALIMMPAHLKRSSTPHCENCSFVGICNGCCCKHSYDICLVPIIPVREYCEMITVKYNFLFYRLYYAGILTPMDINMNNNLSPEFKQYLNLLLQAVVKGVPKDGIETTVSDSTSS